LQQISADIIADLAPTVSDDTKRCMVPCIGTLGKIMEMAKPATIQESAGRALLALFSLKSNRKGFVRDEKSLTRFVRMLDPQFQEIDKKYPVSILLVLAMGGGNGTRRRLADAGSCQHLQKLANADVPGAKKALHKISNNHFKSLFSIGWQS
jgi:hypothetical protein